MRKFINLVGKKFGELTVLAITNERNSDNRVMWQCQCDCGSIKNISGKSLRNGHTKSCGCLLYKDLIGVKSGKLTVIAKDGMIKNRIAWTCRCECGNMVKATTTQINCNRAFSCGCIRKKYRGVGDLSQKYFGNIRRGANRRDYDFKINKQYLWDLFIQQNKRCALSGLDINLVKSYVIDYKLQTASVDRINNTKGYIEDNVWWVHKDVNNVKGSLSMHDFLLYCDLVDNPITTIYSRTFGNYSHNSWKGCGELSGSYYNQILGGAKSRNLDVSVSIEDLWQLYVKQNGQCALTKLMLFVEPSYTKKGRKQTASLDRIDNNQGYTIDNIQWVHKDINEMRMDLSVDRFKHLCKLITERN